MKEGGDRVHPRRFTKPVFAMAAHRSFPTYAPMSANTRVKATLGGLISSKDIQQNFREKLSQLDICLLTDRPLHTRDDELGSNNLSTGPSRNKFFQTGIRQEYGGYDEGIFSL